MNKKLSIIVMALALPLTVSAFPGQKGNFEGRGGERIERLAKKLELNADQKAKLETIFQEQKAKFKAVHEETRMRMQEVLTPEQMTKMDELKKERHEKWQKRKEGEQNR